MGVVNVKDFFEMKITLAQLNYTTGDIDGNTAKIIAAIETLNQRTSHMYPNDEAIDITVEEPEP